MKVLEDLVPEEGPFPGNRWHKISHFTSTWLKVAAAHQAFCLRAPILGMWKSSHVITLEVPTLKYYHIGC